MSVINTFAQFYRYIEGSWNVREEDRAEFQQYTFIFAVIVPVIGGIFVVACLYGIVQLIGKFEHLYYGEDEPNKKTVSAKGKQQQPIKAKAKSQKRNKKID
eukprot:Awhi_evm1s14057